MASDSAVIPSYICAYAGKARPKEGATVLWHPVAYHSLDVMAACDAMIEARPGLLRQLAAAACITEASARAYIMLAAGFHDLGKYADGWQMMLGLSDLVRTPSDFNRQSPRQDHPEMGPYFWDGAAKAALKDVMPKQFQKEVGRWVVAAAGHHGQPVDLDRPKHVDDLTPQTYDDVAHFVSAVCGIVSVSELEAPACEDDPAREQQRAATGLLVAGIVTLADWIGSNTDWFPYEEPKLLLNDYWTIAKTRAKSGIDLAGLRQVKVRTYAGAGDFIGHENEPTHLQNWAEHAPIGDGPQLFILEDLTGSGKTEAALILAHRLIAKGLADGLYFALPTMATANAMYTRMINASAAMFDGAPSLVLAHSATDIAQTLLDQVPDEVTLANVPGEPETASTMASQWLSDERRKAFLAQIGVGTIDQALLGTLPTKHMSVRLAALSDRILIVDEVHSYDAWTGKLLEGILKLHARLGGSAILLSATLTMKAKEKLLTAFADGAAGEPDPVKPVSPAFPMASQWRREAELEETSLLSTRGTRRDLAVQRFSKAEAVVVELIETAQAGGCAVWIRNTVKDAVDATRLVKAASGENINVSLFHSRFTIGDRAKIERAALERFGRSSTFDMRRGQILIATQVIEQSLDVDFDFMVSDLAPIDLLIQRAGRLHRHGRGVRPEPVLGVLAPDPDSGVDANWYARMFPRAAYVYDDHGRLHATLRQILAHGLPLKSQNPRSLLEAIHGGDVDIPDGLIAASDVAWAKAHAERNAASSRMIEADQGYSRATKWTDESKAPTRLGDDTRMLRFATWDGQGLAPWNAHPDPRMSWRMSEIAVAVRTASLRPEIGEVALAKMVGAIEKSWGKRAEYTPIVPLFLADGQWTGTILDQKGQQQRLGYDSFSGLDVQKVRCLSV